MYAPSESSPARESDAALLSALERLPAANEKIARQAFDRVAPECRDLLHRYFRFDCAVRSESQREDLIQTVLTRLWTARMAFTPQGVSAWRGYVRQTARRCYIDFIRVRALASLPEGFDRAAETDEERPLMDALFAAVLSDRLFDLADSVLFQEEASLSEEERNRRLLAAQLFYCDGESWESVARVLSDTMPFAPPIQRVELDRWLSDPAIIRRVAFHCLYYNNAALAAFLLNHETMQKKWTPLQAQVIQWRYHYALSEEQIEARADCPMTKDELRALGDRCAPLFPFEEAMNEIKRRFAARGLSRYLQALSTNALWQRLAFQYRFADDLSHRDILERTLPAARIAEFALTAGMLNVWLSNGRLLHRIARLWNQRYGEGDE